MNAFKILRKNLLLLMKAHNLSQPAAAKKCGVSGKTINNMANLGTAAIPRDITLGMIDKVAIGFSLTADQLLNPELNISDISIDSRFDDIRDIWPLIPEDAKELIYRSVLSYRNNNPQKHVELEPPNTDKSEPNKSKLTPEVWPLIENKYNSTKIQKGNLSVNEDAIEYMKSSSHPEVITNLKSIKELLGRDLTEEDIEQIKKLK